MLSLLVQVAGTRARDVTSQQLRTFVFLVYLLGGHVFYASFALILQGYEGSLLKVTGKNGKSTSVSGRPENPRDPS